MVIYTIRVIDGGYPYWAVVVVVVLQNQSSTLTAQILKILIRKGTTLIP